jgi:hypothetical protein
VCLRDTRLQFSRDPLLHLDFQPALEGRCSAYALSPKHNRVICAFAPLRNCDVAWAQIYITELNQQKPSVLI